MPPVCAPALETKQHSAADTATADLTASSRGLVRLRVTDMWSLVLRSRVKGGHS